MSKLGIVSDTHGFLNETLLAVRLFREHGVQAVIHCGDIGGGGIVEAFQELEAHFVLGNMDCDEVTVRRVVEETGNHFHGWFGSIERAGKRIAFLHGHQSEKMDQEIESGNWDLICYGHTHVPALQMNGKTMLLNPGAFKNVLRPTIAIVTLPELTVERFDI